MKDMNFLKENNARQIWHPMAHPAEMRDTPPIIITEAEGVRVTDIDGHQVIDAVGGLWNVNLGYSCQVVKDAISDQLAALPFYSTFRGTSNDKVIELGYLLSEFFGPDGMQRAFFTSGGSDSVEICLRLARQYHRLRGEAGRTKFLSLKKGYHGTHFGGASVNGNANFRAPYEPLLPGCFHIPAPYAYRNPFNETDPEKLAQLCLQALEDEIAFQGPGSIAAFIMEPVLGAGGVIVPHPSFMPGVRDICDRHGILLIADEVITGFGRTGAETGSRRWGVQPDMMSTAKAITNGYFPFGAAMLSGKVAEVFETDDSAMGMIGSGYTYSGHPVGAAAAVACVGELIRVAPWQNAGPRGDQLFAGLQELAQRHERIGDVRGGAGLMLGIEVVADPATKVPADKATMNQLHQAIFKAGTMVRVSGHNIFMSPPLILAEADVETILICLEEGFSALEA